MKRNRIRLILMLAIAICFHLICIMPNGLEQVKAADSKKEILDIERDMFITVSPTEGAQKCLDSLAPEDGTIVYDLYKVADAIEKNGDLSFELVEKYQPLKDDFENNDWTKAAQQALVLTVGEEGSLVNEPEQAEYTGCSLNTKKQVKAGVYLLLARGSKENSTIVTNVVTAGADIYKGTNMTDGLVTMSLLGINTFRIMPQLICVPGREVSEDTTSQVKMGEWLYDQKIVLKMEEDPATGSIEIEKTLVDYYGNAENATFVFQVDTFYPTPDKLYQSEVYSIQFNKAGTKKIRIDGLPLGATIKIMEIYSGVNYTASIAAPDSINVVVAADSVPVARFTNTYNGKKAGGGGVTNYFKYNVTDGVGEWSWEQKSDNTTTKNGLTNKLLDQILSLFDKGKGN